MMASIRCDDSSGGSDDCLWWKLPEELMVNVFVYLRAVDLFQVSVVCVEFSNKKELMNRTIQSIADTVYGDELTQGFSLQNYAGVEGLYQMELLVLARILSRPSSPSTRPLSLSCININDDDDESNYYVVSKSWIQTTLKWLSTATVARADSGTSPAKSNRKSKKKKQPRRQQRQQRQQQRPWPNINSDLCCPHGNLLPRLPNNYLHHQNNNLNIYNDTNAYFNSSRGRNRTTNTAGNAGTRDTDFVSMDKGAWHVLKKLYPSSTSLALEKGECITCRLDYEQFVLQQNKQKEKEEEERKKPLSCPIVRRVYHRRKGLPTHLLQPSSSDQEHLQLSPNHTYHAIPRSWCRSWRKYIKTGQINDHNTPIKQPAKGTGIPPPDASLLLCHAHKLPLVPPHLEDFLYGETNSLFLGNDALDSNNNVVVEVLSEDEYQALSQFWPASCSSNYSLSFTIIHNSPQPEEVIIDWTTNPCRACDNCPRTTVSKWKDYH